MLGSILLAAAITASGSTATGGDIYSQVRQDATPPAIVEQVEAPKKFLMNSVQYFDSIINVTNRVLSHAIYGDLMRVHTEVVDGAPVFHIDTYRSNRAAVQEHCKKRMAAEGKPANACGAGYRR